MTTWSAASGPEIGLGLRDDCSDTVTVTYFDDRSPAAKPRKIFESIGSMISRRATCRM
jgi:hypothetical protein